MGSEWIKDIALADLPEIYQEVARVVGVEGAIRLSELFGGQVVYFLKIDSLLRKKRNATIRREFNGSNHKELAKKFGLSEQQIRNIVQRGD